MIDALGTISRNLSTTQDALGIADINGSEQVAKLLGTGNVLMKVAFL